MKTKMLLVGLSVGILGFFSNLNAQVTTLTSTGTASTIKTTAGEETDYVTINSVMPYEVVATDWGNLSSILSSAFAWTATGGDLYKRDGNALVAVTGNAGFYPDNQVNVQWTALGAQTLSVTEKSIVTATNAGACSGSPETLPIVVLPWPNVEWNVSTSPTACNVSDVTLPLTLKGSKDVTVYYNVFYTSLTGSEVLVNASPLTQQFTTTGYNEAVASADLTYTLANGPGTYRIQIVNLRDKVTEKSFGGLAETNTARNATSTELPTGSYTFVSYPSPTTQPIKHIKNL